VRATIAALHRTSAQGRIVYNGDVPLARQRKVEHIGDASGAENPWFGYDISKCTVANYVTGQ